MKHEGKILKHSDTRAVVEELRQDTRLWLPPLSNRRGFSSSRVEHLLNRLVRAIPEDEIYLEIGTLEGRTLEAATAGNPNKKIFACDPESKYGGDPDDIPYPATFAKLPWQHYAPNLPGKIGCAFYDADHSARRTIEFLDQFPKFCVDEAVVVMDDWDRQSVRMASLAVLQQPGWSLIAELPEYTDGLTMQPNRFGYYFGIGILGWRR